MGRGAGDNKVVSARTVRRPYRNQGRAVGVLENATGTADSSYRNREVSAGAGRSPYRKESLLVQGLGSASSKGRLYL